MPKFEVLLSNPVLMTATIVIEAEDEDKAVDAAFKKFEEEGGKFDWQIANSEDDVMIEDISEIEEA